MSRLAFLANTVLLAALAGAAAQQPTTPDPGDKTTPLLLKLVREQLASAQQTAPATGVRIDSVRFFRGVLRLEGAISSASQRAKVLEVLGQGRGAIEDEADVKIRQIDADGLVVSGSPTRDGTPDTKTGTSDAIYSDEWGYGEAAFPSFSSQTDGGRFHRFHLRGCGSRCYYDDPDTNAFSMQPSSGGGHRWWRH
jgi:hypothetical protein